MLKTSLRGARSARERDGNPGTKTFKVLARHVSGMSPTGP